MLKYKAIDGKKISHLTKNIIFDNVKANVIMKMKMSFENVKLEQLVYMFKEQCIPLPLCYFFLFLQKQVLDLNVAT